MEKRYVIVRVDNSCPAMLDDFGCSIARNILHCKCGEDAKNYGDTKKQLIKKVAQVIYKEKIEWYKKRIMVHTISKFYCRNAYDSALQVATKIVEFLGVTK